MLDRLKKLFAKEPEPKREPEPMDMLRKTGSYRTLQPSVVAPKPEPPKKKPPVQVKTEVEGRIEEQGPGKNVLVRQRYVREDSGTHETLKILDDSLVETSEEDGIDPYNTGRFDKSSNWDKRFLK